MSNRPRKIFDFDFKLHTKTEVGRTLCHRVVSLRGITHDDILGPCMDFVMTSYTHAILHDCEASRKACGLPELCSPIILSVNFWSTLGLTILYTGDTYRVLDKLEYLITINLTPVEKLKRN